MTITMLNRQKCYFVRSFKINSFENVQNLKFTLHFEYLYHLLFINDTKCIFVSHFRYIYSLRRVPSSIFTLKFKIMDELFINEIFLLIFIFKFFSNLFRLSTEVHKKDEKGTNMCQNLFTRLN